MSLVTVDETAWKNFIRGSATSPTAFAAAPKTTAQKRTPAPKRFFSIRAH